MTRREVGATDAYRSRAELARVLGVDSRTITGWIKDRTDFPSRVRGRRRDFPIARCVAWYLAWKVDRAVEEKPPTGDLRLTELERREQQAKTEIAEMRAAMMRRDLIPREEAEAEGAEFAGRVRAGILAFASRYPSLVLNLTTVPDAVLALRTISNNLLEDLQRAVDVPDEDAPAEAA